MSTALKATPGTVAISDDEMRRFAPSVFASQPIEGVSERYSFLPTWVLGSNGAENRFKRCENSKIWSETLLIVSAPPVRRQR